jgi:hypothetical protein
VEKSDRKGINLPLTERNNSLIFSPLDKALGDVFLLLINVPVQESQVSMAVNTK